MSPIHFPETREQRLARHLAWCDQLHRERLAASGLLGAPRKLPQHLRLVAPTRPASLARPNKSPRRVLRHESLFFATVLASLVCTFVSASVSTPPLASDVVAIAESVTPPAIQPATLRPI